MVIYCGNLRDNVVKFVTNNAKIQPQDTIGNIHSYIYGRKQIESNYRVINIGLV